MKTWKLKDVTETLHQLAEDVKTNIPAFVIVEGKEKKVYPIDTIGTNQRSIVIRVFADEARPFEEIYQLNNDSVWLERVQRYNQIKRD